MVGLPCAEHFRGCLGSAPDFMPHDPFGELGHDLSLPLGTEFAIRCPGKIKSGIPDDDLGSGICEFNRQSALFGRPQNFTRKDIVRTAKLSQVCRPAFAAQMLERGSAGDYPDIA